MNCSILDRMCALEKRSGASLEEKKEFMDTYTELLKEEGYSERAENYLFDGFVFGATSSVFSYITTQKNPLEAYKDILLGKRYKTSTLSQDVGKKFFFQLELLSYVITRKGNYLELMKFVIKELSPLAYTKNKKNIRNHFRKEFYNYFVRRLASSNSEWVAWSDLGLTFEESNAFIKLVEEYLIQEDVTRHRAIMERLADWIPVDKERIVKARLKGQSDEAQSEEIKRLRIAVESLRKGNSTLDKRLMYLSNENKYIAEKLQQMEEKYAELEIKYDQSEKRCGELSVALRENEQKLQQSHDEIVARKQDTAMMSDDYEQKLNIALNRIAARLKTDYNDFKDVKNMEMTVDLGESLRIQMDSVFKTLIKNGIEL